MAGLAALGKVAGIGGVALGVVALVLRGVLAGLGKVPVKERAAMYNRLIAVAFGIGVLGIVAWMVGQPSGPTATTTGPQSPAIIGSGATVTYSTPPPAAPAR